MNLRPLGTRILQNGYGDTIVVAEIERRGRKDYIPAENWRELEPAARDYLESLGISISETGNYECPQHIAERARFGFEVFWAQSGLRWARLSRSGVGSGWVRTMIILCSRYGTACRHAKCCCWRSITEFPETPIRAENLNAPICSHKDF